MAITSTFIGMIVTLLYFLGFPWLGFDVIDTKVILHDSVLCAEWAEAVNSDYYIVCGTGGYEECTGVYYNVPCGRTYEAPVEKGNCVRFEDTIYCGNYSIKHCHDERKVCVRHETVFPSSAPL